MAGRPLAGRLSVVRASVSARRFGALPRQGNLVRKLRPVFTTTYGVLGGPSLTVCGAASGKLRGITVKCLLAVFCTLPERE